jgi:hypothetical protein
MTPQIEDDYFQWLTSQIELPADNPHTYNDLFTRMHEIEFVWSVPHDDDRVQDGLNLRNQFLNGRRYKFTSGVSVLEVLIALSIRVAFTAGGYAPIWAWQLIENLHLDRRFDPFTKGRAERVDETLETLIWRTYQRDGKGGFFPLNQALEDQTKVDIWNQMNMYVNEIQQL